MRRVVIKESAQKEFETLPIRIQDQIAPRIWNLASDPLPSGHKKLKGIPCYRIRSGDYRILYHFDAETVTIVAIRHRKDAYQ